MARLSDSSKEDKKQEEGEVAVPADIIAKWVKVGFTSVGGVLALMAVAPHMAAASDAAADTKAQATAPAEAKGVSAERIAKGRELFNNWSCGSCHALQDADAFGDIGPSLDGDPHLTEALIVDRVTNGQGPMPAFGGQLSEEEITDIAAYIHKVALK